MRGGRAEGKIKADFENRWWAFLRRSDSISRSKEAPFISNVDGPAMQRRRQDQRFGVQYDTVRGVQSVVIGTANNTPLPGGYFESCHIAFPIPTHGHTPRILPHPLRLNRTIKNSGGYWPKFRGKFERVSPSHNPRIHRGVYTQRYSTRCGEWPIEGTDSEGHFGLNFDARTVKKGG